MNIHNVRWNGQVAVVKKKPREIGSGKGIGRERGEREQSWYRHGVRYVILRECGREAPGEPLMRSRPSTTSTALCSDFEIGKIQKRRRWSVSRIFEHTQAPTKRFRDDAKSYIIKFVHGCLLFIPHTHS